MADPFLETLVTKGPIETTTIHRLNHELFPLRPKIELSIYGDYGITIDLSVVRHMPNVRRLAFHFFACGTGSRHLADIPALEALTVDVTDLKDFDFLEDMNPEYLTYLSLGQTTSRKPSVASISRFSKLKGIYLHGPRKGLESISALSNLEQLRLRTITTPSLDFLVGLKNLWLLEMKLGATNNLVALRKMPQLKSLEIWSVIGLTDISPISEVFGLQSLELDSTRLVTHLPNFSRLTALRRLTLTDLKSLVDISPIFDAVALEEFGHFNVRNFQPDDYLPLLERRSMKKLRVGFCLTKQYEQFKQMVVDAGIPNNSDHRFEFI